MSASLTFRQERFALEYLKDQNASAAAARAGYQAKNMAAQGHELLNIPAIRDRIRMEMDAMLAEIRCSAFALMKQRMKAAFFDAGKLFKGGWELRAPEELDAETRSAVEVTSVTRKSGPVVRMKQPDRDRALRALEKVHERLEKLNEAHYAALEKAGKLPTLEEIEAMDAGEAPVQPVENTEKCRVLSGSAGDAFDVNPSAGTRPSTGSGRTVEGGEIPEECRVLSGSTFHLADLGSPGPAPGLSERGTRPSTGSGRTVRECEISEKPRVLSGSAGGLNASASRIPVKTQVLSGSAFSLGCLSSRDCAPGLGGRGARPSTGSGRTVRECEISEKPRVLSGSAVESAPRIPVKTQVLSGSAFSLDCLRSRDCVPGLGGRGTRPSTGSGRTVGGGGNPEKHRVLSGSLPRLSPLAAAIRGMAGALPA
jgi:phage terminase small subunit